MNPVSPSKSASATDARPPKPPAASPASELRTLKAAVSDLQTKRLSTLRLYHDEKARRQQEATRAELLTAQLHSLQQSKLRRGPFPPPSSSHPLDPIPPTQAASAAAVSVADAGSSSNTLSCNGVVSSVSQVARLPPIHPSSLNWYSLSLEDALNSPPQVIAWLNPVHPAEHSPPQPSSPTESPPQLPEHNEPPVYQDEIVEHCTPPDATSLVPRSARLSSKLSSYDDHAPSDPDAIHDDHPQPPNPSSASVPTVPFAPSPPLNSPSQQNIEQLENQLRIAQTQAAEAHNELKQSERLIADLREQLDASTVACRQLIDTINEQEDTITHLSEK